MRRVMLVAGEASGDLHGSNLVRAARELAPDLSFYGVGGPRLEQAGMDLMFDLEHMSLMGLTEVFSGLARTLSILRRLKRSLKNDRPDGLVLIDYPDFNLLLAKAAQEAQIPVFYYICPQIWAWRRGRVRKMARLADRRVIVFPFEKEFYESRGTEADFVGHPLLDIMDPPRPKAEAKAELGLDPDRTWLLLMPGSRRHVVRELLPIMLGAVRILRQSRPDLGLVLARAETLSPDFLAPWLENGPEGLKVVEGNSHRLQNAADLALVASGTSTLETALMLTPMVVIYRLSHLSYQLGKLLVRVDHVAMANLIAGRRLVPELIQHEAGPVRIATELDRLIGDEDLYRETLAGLEGIRSRLGGPGASRRAAALLLETIDHKNRGRPAGRI